MSIEPTPSLGYLRTSAPTGRPWWRRITLLNAAAIGCAVTGSLLVAWVALCRLSSTTSPLRGPRHVAIQGHEMILQGPIDTDLGRRFDRAMAEPHDRIDTVLLDSTGGYEAIALQIAKALARSTPREIVIPPGYVCESACILIGLAAGEGFNPADNARLMFHRGTATFGATTCAACELPDSVLNAFRDHIDGPEWRREMKRWADLLAPGLGDRLATCRHDAFDTQKGVTITGLEFKRFRAGQPDAIAC